MIRKAKWTLDSVIRVVVSLGLILSVLGIPATSMPAAQAKVVSQTISEPQSETQPSAKAAAAFDSPLPLPTPQPTILPTPQATLAPLPVTTMPALTATQMTVDARGGRVTTGDNRVRLDVPPGLFANSTRLSITPHAVMAHAPVGIKVQFDLTAQDVASNTLISMFAQPVTITVDLNGLVDKAQLRPGEHLALFYQTANPDAPWSELVDAQEVQPGVLQVPLMHFSLLLSRILSGAASAFFDYVALRSECAGCGVEG